MIGEAVFWNRGIISHKCFFDCLIRSVWAHERKLSPLWSVEFLQCDGLSNGGFMSRSSYGREMRSQWVIKTTRGE
ncbi:hypothetical protein HMPREF2760_03095 [Corynebacterium sp. HMSC065D07]|nr:hypothetical protein HMPREF2760_03095 [Corynebacterium sp. HMSC065D07]